LIAKQNGRRGIISFCFHTEKLEEKYFERLSR